LMNIEVEATCYKGNHSENTLESSKQLALATLSLIIFSLINNPFLQ
jgi:hypothetical protein